MDFGTYIENLKRIDIQQICVEALRTFEVFLADLNAEQMRFGLNVDGKEIGYYMSQEYASWKKSRGGLAPDGVVDLFLTGALNSKIFAEVKEDSILFGSRDEKSDMLEGKYNRNGKIYGLSDKAKSIVIEPLLAEIIERINVKLAA